MPWNFLEAGATLLGSLLLGDSQQSAAETSAAAQQAAAQQAADVAKFRPVGITTGFGSSQFAFDPQGYLQSAGYTLAPGLEAQRNRLFALSSGGLTQAEQAPAAYAPLGQAAQGLFGLGQKYLAQTPEQVAQQYMQQQQALLAPGREQQLAQLQNQMFQTGRGGLAVGGTSGGGGGVALDRKSTRLNSSHSQQSRMPSSA